MLLKNNRSTTIAFGGLLTALCVVFIYLSSIIPFNKLLFLCLASFSIILGVLLIGIKNSILIYVGSLILSLILLGIRETTFAYIIFFGPYGIVKNFIENIGKLPFEIVLKLIFFNIVLGASYLVYSQFAPMQLKTTAPIYVLLILSQFLFLGYDYILTVFIHRAKKHKV